jgi:hypothetical protein
MDLQLIPFVVLVFTTFFNTGIQWYTHQQSYPLMALVGVDTYETYFHEYERRLVLALYIPYFIMLVSNITLFFLRPAGIDLLWLVIAFALNLSIMVVSFALAVPIHKRHAQAGQVTSAGVAELLQVNILRLGAATLSSGIMLFLLLRLLTN